MEHTRCALRTVTLTQHRFVQSDPQGRDGPTFRFDITTGVYFHYFAYGLLTSARKSANVVVSKTVESPPDNARDVYFQIELTYIYDMLL